jgi:hypothetical protein
LTWNRLSEKISAFTDSDGKDIAVKSNQSIKIIVRPEEKIREIFAASQQS